MKKIKTLIMLFLVSAILVISCASNTQKQEIPELGTAIGELVVVSIPETISLEGYGLVGGLKGTGSSQCPPAVRTYLKKYIKTQLSDQTEESLDALINSADTSVVRVEATMPVAAAKGDYFDVKVSTLPGSLDSSLDLGWLYKTELVVEGTFGIKTEVFADVEGPVFFNKIDSAGFNRKSGYILGGGKVLLDYTISLTLKNPDFLRAAYIRNRLNELFGGGIANAVSANLVELKIPTRYKDDLRKFVALIGVIYIDSTEELNNKRIQFHIRELAESGNKERSELALQTLGSDSISSLTSLLNSNNPEVRFRACRCMLNLGSSLALQELKNMTLDTQSPYRIEALEAIAAGATSSETVSAAKKLLTDNDFNVRLAAYKQLRKLGDNSIRSEIIAGNFYLEQILQQGGQRVIYVSRSGQPKIVIFGAPILCKSDVFLESSDGEIMLNSSPGQDYLTIIRKHPARADTLAQLRSSYQLDNIIRTLCNEPSTGTQAGSTGLGVPYADMIALLKLMTEKGAIDAQYIAGPMPEID